MDVPATLTAADAAFRAGNEDQAKALLGAVLASPDALPAFERIVPLCLALKDAEQIERLTELAAADVEMSRRLPRELRLIDGLIGKEMRKEAFRQLQKLVPLVDGDIPAMRAVAERLPRIGEDSQAFELFKRVAKAYPDDMVLERAIIKAMIGAGRPGGLDRLDRYVQRPDATAEDWEFASNIYKYAGTYRQVLTSASRALALGGDVVRNRMTLITTRQKHRQFREAAAQIRRMPLDQIEDIWQLRNLAHLALHVRAPRLAVKIAEAQWRRHQDRPFAALFYLQFLASVRHGAAKRRQVLDGLFATLEEGSGMEATHFVKLAELCFQTFHSDALELRAIEIGLKQHPGNEALMAAKSQNAARGQFVSRHGAGRRSGDPSPNLLERLRRGWRRDTSPL
jgi:hypothetical protein